ncbi:MAG: FAD-dependent oxidoreductase [Chloroflexi bacterium]|nr:FAD-dependent oxidoreductase [Chloroflexota bacterium]
MRDVIIIGGGLSGLAAAVELDNLRIAYTLVEVKARLGGSISSRQQDGFIMDGGASVFPAAADWSFLPELGLNDALFELDSRRVAFKDGTQALTDALVRRLKGDLMLRMAVSSLGRSGESYAVCLENGLMLTARTLIVAAPARYAGHMFRTLQPDISLRLWDYGYDTITRVSLGFRRADVPLIERRIWDMGLPFFYELEHPSRVPPESTLFHIGVRYPLPRTTPEALIATLQTELEWPKPPLVSWVTYWPEADPIPPHTAAFREDMAALMRLLPDGMALIGSDYNGLGLGERFAAGVAAARQMAAFLR